MGITIVVPVGSNPAYLAYLPECLASIDMQIRDGDQILIIDDQAHLELADYSETDARHTIYKTVWLSGCAHAWNYGVALARHEWCILMGSDDKLMAGCLNACHDIIANNPDPLGYYHLTWQLDTGEIHTVFNNAAMVSKALWKHTGGFPITSTIGAPDAMLGSIMTVHLPSHCHQVRDGTPLYWVRQHEQQNTRAYANVFHQEVINIRNIETQRWTPALWTR